MAAEEHHQPGDTPAKQKTRGAAGQGRYVLAGALGTMLLLVIGGILAGILLRDPLPPLTEEAFEAAQQRWSESGIVSYHLQLQITGARPATVELEVRGKKVWDPPLIDGQPVRRQHTWDTWTVAGQFDTIARELEMAGNPQGEAEAAADTQVLLHARFHPEHGYPVRFRRIVLGELPEVSWRVLSFEIIR